MAKTGRPVTKTGAAAAKHRLRSRKEYQNLSPEKKRQRVANRDKEAQRKADEKRYAKAKPERDSYHRAQAKAKKKAPPRPKSCSWPGCKRTNIQFHHQGVDRWLCPTHHAMARNRSQKEG